MDRFREIALWLGLTAGVGIALASLVQLGDGAPPEGAAAVADGAEVSRDHYLRTLATFAAREQAPALDGVQRRRVLEELVAEELLLSRALALELPRRDPLLRRRVIAQLLADITAEAAARPVEEAELRAMWADEPELFAGRLTWEVETVWFRGDAATSLERAAAARRALVAGEPFEDVARRGDEPLLHPPMGALPHAALREYLGPTAARRVTEMAPGEISEPIRVTGGHRILRLAARHASPPADFESVRESARTIWVRRRQAAAIEAYVAELREAAAVTLDEALLDPAFAIPDRYLEEARRPGAEPGKR